MQSPLPLNMPQLPLFQDALWARGNAPLPELLETEPTHAFSEISLRGQSWQCLTLLAPLLRELSEEDDTRWLTLVAPPAALTRDWLCKARLNRERILLLQARDQAAALNLSCEALRLGRSHTVVSWLQNLGGGVQDKLSRAALAGQAKSLNIRLE